MNKQIEKKEVLKRILFYVKGYGFFVALLFLFSLLSVALSLYLPVAVGKAIDQIAGKGEVNFPVLSQKLMVIIGVTVCTAILQWLMGRLNNKIVYGVVGKMREDVFSHLQKLPLSYIDAHPKGDLVERIINDAEQFGDGLLVGFTQLFTGIVTIVGTLIFMMVLQPMMGIVVVCLTPLSLLVAKYISEHTYHFFSTQAELSGLQTSYIEEMIGNLKLVQSFSQERYSVEEFDKKNDELEEISLNAVFYSSLTNPCTRFVNSIVYAVVALCGAVISLIGTMSIGVLASFLSYAKQYTKPFNEISGVITELQNSLARAARLFALLEEQTEEEEKEAICLQQAEGIVSFEEVEFSYDKSKTLITGLEFTARPGEKIAIVGPTGCGKTTLINLLMRFYEVDKGNILVDHRKSTLWTRKSLRLNFGMVLQDTWLMNGTVAENIAFAKPEATREEVIAAAKAAYCHHFIERLPRGYDTPISEDKGNLSEGQKQLLCIARVMISLPPMLILDEATSSIDTRTEVKIQQAFAKMMNGRVSFIVAHRLSTIKDADLILVMNKGNIEEQGTHEELMEKKGFYYRLYCSKDKEALE